MLTNAHLPILGFAAWSGTGKTTLLLRPVLLDDLLAGRGPKDMDLYELLRRR